LVTSKTVRASCDRLCIYWCGAGRYGSKAPARAFGARVQPQHSRQLWCDDAGRYRDSALDYSKRHEGHSVRPHERSLAEELDKRLLSVAKNKRALPGIRNGANREAFVEQLVESIRRIRFIRVIGERDISGLRAEPSSDLFDPLKAAILHQRQGRIDEAFWLVFLSVHFGRHRTAGWRLARDVYGALGGDRRWDWVQTSSNPRGFRRWLDAHQGTLRSDGIPRHFGNHRKFQSLDAWSVAGTGAAVESYVRWVRPYESHEMLVQEALAHAGGDPRKAFDCLYRSMDAVASFGRLARFDYLTMVGKLRLAPIEPGSTYLQGASGPASGACLLFAGSANANLDLPKLEAWLVDLEAQLNLQFGMQVLEDALCNWQKSPGKFKPFRG
jgi:Alpha-glutamyl/putrescinyl thymine pyrophosphorylase clade 3